MKRFTLIIALLATACIASTQLEVLDFSIDMSSSNGVVTQTEDLTVDNPVELFSYVLYKPGSTNIIVDLDINDFGVMTEIVSASTNGASGSTTTVITPTLTIYAGAVTNAANTVLRRPVAKTIRVTAVRSATTNTPHCFLRGRIYGNRVMLE
jgi:hypothetical protein